MIYRFSSLIIYHVIAFVLEVGKPLARDQAPQFRKP